MAATNRYRKRRHRLYIINPYCPFCGVYMIEPETLVSRKKGQIKYFPDNTCTLEHLYPKGSSHRTRKNNNSECRNIICCYKCNHSRGKKSEMLINGESHKQERLKFIIPQHRGYEQLVNKFLLRWDIESTIQN